MSLENINLNLASIVDVRTIEEFNDGNIPGSINIPLDQVVSRVKEFEQLKKPLVLICASGNRSGKATEYLKSQGITEVYNGGGWQDVASQLS